MGRVREGEGETISSAAVGEHEGDVFGIALIHDGLGGQVSLELGALVIQQVIAEGTPAHEFAGAGDLEPLGGSFAGLELRHFLGRGHKRSHYGLEVPTTD